MTAKRNALSLTFTPIPRPGGASETCYIAAMSCPVNGFLCNLTRVPPWSRRRIAKASRRGPLFCDGGVLR
jgi:hypothetical protein